MDGHRATVHAPDTGDPATEVAPRAHPPGGGAEPGDQLRRRRHHGAACPRGWAPVGAGRGPRRRGVARPRVRPANAPEVNLACLKRRSGGRQSPGLGYKRVVSCKDSFHGTDVLAVSERNTALRDGARTSTRTSSVAKGRTASIHCRPAPPRQTEALSSRTSRSRPLKTSQPSGARAKNERSESGQGS